MDWGQLWRGQLHECVPDQRQWGDLIHDPPPLQGSCRITNWAAVGGGDECPHISRSDPPGGAEGTGPPMATPCVQKKCRARHQKGRKQMAKKLCAASPATQQRSNSAPLSTNRRICHKALPAIWCSGHPLAQGGFLHSETLGLPMLLLCVLLA